MAPVGLLAILLMPFVGKNSQKVDPRILSSFAFITFALVLWLRSLFNTQADVSTLLIPTFIQGIAMAFFFVPLMTLIMSDLPPERIAAASGLSNFARITAGAFGTSITTTLWDNRAALHHAELVEFIDGASIATNQALTGLAATGLSREQGLLYINRLVDQQAFMLSANDIFAFSSALFVALIAVIWFARPRRSGVAVDAGGAH
jgi:DHA2 family multidrug resistance protein